MRTVESQAATATQPASDTPPARRLVIRVKLVPEEPAVPPVHRRLSKGALVLVVGVVAVGLSWAGISLLRTEPAAAPIATETTQAPRPQPPVPTQPAELPVAKPSDGPPSPVDEVIPEVPQSALDTIRGTVRVSVLVTIDNSGTVLTATADDRGPSRYFERLSVGAAKKWTFTPATAEEQRRMLVKFNYTRTGAAAHTESPQQ